MKENNTEDTIYRKKMLYDKYVELEGPTEQLVIRLAITEPKLSMSRSVYVQHMGIQRQDVKPLGNNLS